MRSALHTRSGRMRSISGGRSNRGTPRPSGARISASESTKVSAVLHAHSSPGARASSPAEVPITPFGVPVEPLVKRIYATSGGSARGTGAGAPPGVPLELPSTVPNGEPSRMSRVRIPVGGSRAPDSREGSSAVSWRKLAWSVMTAAGPVRASSRTRRPTGTASTGMYTPFTRQMANIATMASADRGAISAISGRVDSPHAVAIAAARKHIWDWSAANEMHRAACEPSKVTAASASAHGSPRTSCPNRRLISITFTVSYNI
eukprot:scaffold4985_cov116-Isochrysis_galbana.AAC.4